MYDQNNLYIICSISYIMYGILQIVYRYVISDILSMMHHMHYTMCNMSYMLLALGLRTDVAMCTDEVVISTSARSTVLIPPPQEPPNRLVPAPAPGLRL